MTDIPPDAGDGPRVEGSAARPALVPAQPPVAPQAADGATAPGKRWHVVRRDAFDAVVAESLAAVVARELGNVPSGILGRVRDALIEELRIRIAGEGRNLRAISKEDFLLRLERSNDELLARREEAQRELAELERKVAGLESHAEGSGASAAGLRPGEIRARVLGFLEERLRQTRSRDDLGRSLLEWAGSLVQEDRRRRGLDVSEANVSESLDRYRRRIEKLRAALQETESELEEVSLRAVRMEEEASSQATMSLLESRRLDEARRALMRRLFEQNVALQAALRGA